MRLGLQRLKSERGEDPYDPDLEKLIGGLGKYEKLCLEAFALCGNSVVEISAWGSLYGFSRAEILSFVKIVSEVKAGASSPINS